MALLTVASFYVDRRTEYPDAVDYVPLLKILDRSCRRFGMAHIVLTDKATAPELLNATLTYFATDLPRNLTRAFTEAQARWLEFPHRGPLDTLFVGADCLIRRDFREYLPEADLSIILRPGHRKHRINNGFQFIPAASRTKVAPLFRLIADSTGFVMCDDMVAVERALAPMPTEFGMYQRHGLSIQFLPMPRWNGGPKTASDEALGSFVLHFRGQARKAIMLDWAARHLPGGA